MLLVAVTKNIFNPQIPVGMEGPAASTLPHLVIFDLVLAADVEEFFVLIHLDPSMTIKLLLCVIV